MKSCFSQNMNEKWLGFLPCIVLHYCCRAEILTIFCSYFGRIDDLINSFRNLLTFRKRNVVNKTQFLLSLLPSFCLTAKDKKEVATSIQHKRQRRKCTYMSKTFSQRFLMHLMCENFALKVDFVFMTNKNQFFPV